MPAVKSDTMRGLAVFISDIRNCKSKEAEVKRINKELANIRSKFKGDKTLDGYMKKKYVCKLLFIFLLGHDIDFGHMEAVNLLSSNKYTEKQIGYLFISVLISENNELMRLVVQNLKNDLSSRNPIHVNLALQCIANIGSREMAETFAPEIPKLLVSGETMDTVKQSAALCLLKLMRTAPDCVAFGEWTARVVHLLNDQHMGVVTAAVSLIETLVKRNPDEYKGCVSLAVSRLSRIVTSSYTDLQDYTYYFVPAPWLSVKLLRLLQNYQPPEDPTVRSRLTECLESILNKTQEAPKSKKVQHSNAKNAVLFEAINLIIHMDSDPQLLVRASNQLGQFLQHRETNLRYLALESMCLLATSEFSHEAVKKNQETVVNALKSERDVSVRQRAVDLLYAMCDKSNAEEIVGEMLVYLETADYSIREEMVLKVAILAEKYASDYTWYVDTILNLIRVAGDYVSEEVWYRVIQIVINRDDVQGYAAKTVFEALQAPACHENMVKVGGYILGEFGNLIAGDQRSSPSVQFQLLHDKFHLCSSSTRQLLLSTYVKFVNLFPEIKGQITDVLLNDANIKSSDVEIQQRAVEYHQLMRLASTDVLATVLEEMPPFPERESSILAKLKQKKPATTDPNQRSASAAVTAAASGSKAEEAAPPSSSGGVLNLTGDTGGGESEVDLLGLGSADATLPSRPADSSNRDLLAEFLGGSTPAAAPAPASNGSLLDANDVSSAQHSQVTATFSGSAPRLLSGEENLSKFVIKNSGVLFENDLLQVGVKAEFRQNLGRMGIFYGNKTANRLTDVSSELRFASPEMAEQLQLQMRPIDTTIEAGQQAQQMLNVECLADFTSNPQMAIHFKYAGSTPQSHVLPLPVFLNKFLQTTEMDATVFFQRWKQLPQDQETQRVFRAKIPIEASAVRTKFTGFGFSLLEGVDPNPDNLVGAGVVHTRSSQVGVLVRLELNMQAQAYRLTMRSTREVVSRTLADLLEAQL